IARNEAAMIAQARALLAMGPRAVLIKGGHGTQQQSTDLLVDADGVARFASERLHIGEFHGGGCMFSAGIAAGRARGWPLGSSIANAKKFISQTLAAAPSHALGSGSRLLHPQNCTGQALDHDAAAAGQPIHNFVPLP
ncbi:MAG: thiD, partial [Devosia sp.]|nr:thiD [Devosia sp.]